jgi:hypothetical protein
VGSVRAEDELFVRCQLDNRGDVCERSANRIRQGGCESEVVSGKREQVTATHDNRSVYVAVTAHIPGTLFPCDVRIRLAASNAC